MFSMIYVECAWDCAWVLNFVGYLHAELDRFIEQISVWIVPSRYADDVEDDFNERLNNYRIEIIRKATDLKQGRNWP